MDFEGLILLAPRDSFLSQTKIHNILTFNSNKIMQINVGNYEVLYSGIVTSLKGEDVLFSIETDFKVRLRFVNLDKAEQSISPAIADEGREFVLTLTNFNNGFGSDMNKTLNIGVYQGRNLFIHLNVAGRTNGNKHIIYSFLLGGTVSNE